MTPHWTTARIVELLTIATSLVIGGLWLGSLNSRVEAGETQLAEVAREVKATPTQVAVLQTQMSNTQDTVREIKDRQVKQDEKLDKILDEVRRQ